MDERGAFEMYGEKIVEELTSGVVSQSRSFRLRNKYGRDGVVKRGVEGKSNDRRVAVANVRDTGRIHFSRA